MAKMTMDQLHTILTKPQTECDGFEFHVRHLWNRREWQRLFEVTGVLPMDLGLSSMNSELFTKLQKVHVTQDESGHWYVIPVDLKEEFLDRLNVLMEENDPDLEQGFDEKFGKYRTGGDLNLVQLYAEV